MISLCFLGRPTVTRSEQQRGDEALIASSVSHLEWQLGRLTESSWLGTERVASSFFSLFTSTIVSRPQRGTTTRFITSGHLHAYSRSSSWCQINELIESHPTNRLPRVAFFASSCQRFSGIKSRSQLQSTLSIVDYTGFAPDRLGTN